jgi:hypothetical protein
MQRYPRKIKTFRARSRTGNKRMKWPKIKLSEVLSEAGIYVLTQDNMLTRRELMHFYFDSAVVRKRKRLANNS